MEWVVMVGITESQVPVDWARSRMRGLGKPGGGVAMLASRPAFLAAKPFLANSRRWLDAVIRWSRSLKGGGPSGELEIRLVMISSQMC